MEGQLHRLSPQHIALLCHLSGLVVDHACSFRPQMEAVETPVCMIEQMVRQAQQRVIAEGYQTEEEAASRDIPPGGMWNRSGHYCSR